jgi:hypothetical protein
LHIRIIESQPQSEPRFPSSKTPTSSDPIRCRGRTTGSLTPNSLTGPNRCTVMPAQACNIVPPQHLQGAAMQIVCDTANLLILISPAPQP